MTVSRALRGVDGVSAERRQEVQKIARSLGYRPNRPAQALALAHSNLVCVSLPNLFNDVFPGILDGMRAALDRAGLDAVLDVSDYDPARVATWVERMLEWRPAAVILTGVDHAEGVREKLGAAAIPTLEVWDVRPDPIDICVGVDHFAAGKQLGDYLRELGYRRPAFVGSTKDVRAEKRFLGLSSAFPGHSIPVARISGQPSFVEGGQGALSLLEAHKPDVIAFLNDHMAFGGLCALERAGLSCPRDIGVAGFNALGLNDVLPRRMTTVVTPRREMGELGARRLIARTKGVNVPACAILPTRLVEGGTTRRIG